VNEIYSPAKSSAVDARKAAEAGNPTHSPTTSEFDVYHAFTMTMARIGCSMEAGVPRMLNGLKVMGGPQVVLAPSFATTQIEVRVRCGPLLVCCVACMLLLSSCQEPRGLNQSALLINAARRLCKRALSNCCVRQLYTVYRR
jgi:hypothetical protein